MKLLPCGDTGLLIEVDGLAEVHGLSAAIRAADLDGVLDVVPAAQTVLLVVEPGADLDALGRSVGGLEFTAGDAPDGETVEIEVVYDGPDLDEVGELTGLGADGVVDAHTGTPWRVGFVGFAPGFAYLDDGDERLDVARRDDPRTSVPPGSVGLAGGYSAVYPRASPGGWQLIGRTDAVLWDETRDPPALLQPGARVRFVQAPHGTSTLPKEPVQQPRGSMRRGLEVLSTGVQAVVQDLGRPGHAASGVGRSGAADRAALKLANRLVANPEDAAGIEVVFGGLAVRAGRRLTVATAGAPAGADVDGTPVGHHALVELKAGQVLRLGQPPVGLRTYLAVRGGIDVPAVLGSRSTDVLSRVGPAVLEEGDVLPVGGEPTELPLIDVAPVALPAGGTVTLRARLGPRADWVDVPEALARTEWTVSSRSDRVGVRLEGEPLRRRDSAEIASEGMVTGAVQVPPGGEPVLFMADHPVTGGYPVVAVVLDADIDKAAQLRPGQRVRFKLVR
ncbi:5-oxoprolinase/urea amidolyase family protein [Pseudonocardia sp. TRM90224]|uniref:5-oxoprolinase subunit B/C family protein n=1 Tax=Pseudonocardia sp. TRM90224 TaxID=2812678 RepID=UPI0027DED37B|nr:5-oxoprolinase/urea amidolyase family protein [Pseudonocardia sp. TRM90224]